MTRRRRLLVGLVLACGVLAVAFGYGPVKRRLSPDGPAEVGDTAGRGRGGAGRRGGPSGGRATGSSDDGPVVRVRGTVVDSGTAKGVGGGEVVFSGPRGETTTRADAEGHYEAFVHPGAYRAFVRGPGIVSVVPRVREWVSSAPRLPAPGATQAANAPLVVVTEDESGVDLAVRTAATVAGRVTNRSGQPVAHAVVRARGSSERPVLGTDVVETDGDGAFAFELPSGVYYLDASHPDYAGLADATATLTVDATVRPAPLALTLVAGCVITGRVLGVDGAPANDGSVDHKRAGMPDFRPSGSLEPDGTFRWTTVEEGEVSLRAWAWMSPPTPAETFQCKDGARLEATLRLPATDSNLDGTLTTASGAPVPFAFLDIHALSPGGVSQEERTDGKGEWAVFTMPPGDYLVTATVPGEGFVERRVTVPSHEVDLALGGTGSISGTVSGVPDGAVSMEVSGCMLHPSRHPGSQSEARVVPVHGGRFRIDGVSACELSMMARAGSVVARAEVTVAARREAAVSLDLAPPPPVAVAEPPADEDVVVEPGIEQPAPAPEAPAAVPEAPAPEAAAVDEPSNEPAEDGEVED